MSPKDFMALKPGDAIQLPMDQERIIETAPRNVGSQRHPHLRCSVSEAWYDANYREHFFTVDSDDVIA